MVRHGRFFPRLLLVLALMVLATAAFGTTALAQSEQADSGSPWFDVDESGQVQLHLYFFWSRTCPHCLEAHPLVDSLPGDYPWLVLHSHEITTSQENAQLYSRMAAAAGEEAMYVPAFIFCGTMMTGYDTDQTTGQVLKDSLNQCRTYIIDEILPQMEQAQAPSAASQSAAAAEAAQEESQAAASNPEGAVAANNEPAPAAAPQPAVELTGAGMPAAQAATLSLPLVGTVSPEALSLPMLTLIIAGLDAFNPCAFFVLMFLLSLMVHARNRRRMLLIGAVFVFFSGLIYFLFMTAWLNIFLVVGELRIITLVAGIVAVIIALINIKDFFWFKQGVSLSIPDSARPALYQRTRNLLKASSLPAMLFGTAVLAIAANSYELLCTAGFPMVYTRMLTLHELPTGVFYAYLAAYNIVYVVPLFLIVTLFTVRFGSRKLTEQEGRILKLVSGLMMLMLGGLLVVAPAALNQVTTAIYLLLATLVLAGIIILVDRWMHHKDGDRSSPAMR